MKWTCGFSPSY